jgi:hypothetical protein
MVSDSAKSMQASELSKPKWTVQRIILMSSGALGGIIVLIFVIGLIFTFSDSLEVTAARTRYIRDILLITLTLEGLLITGALAVLIVQISRIVSMLKKEIRPVIASAQQTVNTTKVTAEFVGESLTEPIVRTGTFMTGVRILIRDVGGIRRAIRHTTQDKQQNDS